MSTLNVRDSTAVIAAMSCQTFTPKLFYSDGKTPDTCTWSLLPVSGCPRTWTIDCVALRLGACSSSPSLPTSLPVDPAIRRLAESSDVYQNVDINFKEPHDLKLCKEVYDGTKRVKAYSCELCKVKKPNPPISDKNRTKYKCVQCSSVALKASDIIYLHPECFGEYHRRKYRTVLGSSNVKGLVIGT